MPKAAPWPGPPAWSHALCFLGLTEASLGWLADAAGSGFARARHRELSEALRHDGEAPLPAAAVDQVAAAAAVLARSAPGSPLALSAMPLGVGEDSGSGLAYSCDPTTGEPGLSGVFASGATGAELLEGKGEDLRVEADAHEWGGRLSAAVAAAQQRFEGPVRAEFVVERSRLWVLAVHDAALRGAAMARAAGALGREGTLSPGQALSLVRGADLAEALAPDADVSGLEVAARGVGVSPGVVSGAAVFSRDAAVAVAARGGVAVLVLTETRPEDLPGLLAASAVITEQTARTSHAAVVARGLGRPCVTALRGATIDAAGGRLRLAASGAAGGAGRASGHGDIAEGDEITVDGQAGVVYRDALEAGAGAARPATGAAEAGRTRDSLEAGSGAAPPSTGAADLGRTRDALEAGAGAATPSTRAAGRTRSDASLAWLLGCADDTGGIAVRVNADTGADAARGRAAGAKGVGLCRVEHVFLGERQPLLERALLIARGAEAVEAIDEVRAVLRDEFAAVLRAMDGLPVAVRLLDPPRHEFLPDLAELTARAAVAEASGLDAPDPGRLAAARRLHERNPMLGVRGARLALLRPELTVAQLEALLEAAESLRRAGGDPRPELLVPMVSDPVEVEAVSGLLQEVRAGWHGWYGHEDAMAIPLGAMVETPRAALCASALAKRSDFLSIGTNDLTALVWGVSRDDAERELLPAYEALGIVDASPFDRLDLPGVAELVRVAVRDARHASRGIPIGVCGEHAGQEAALRRFAALGIDYVSCAPPALPVARLAAARAALGAVMEDEHGAAGVAHRAAPEEDAVATGGQRLR